MNPWQEMLASLTHPLEEGSVNDAELAWLIAQASTRTRILEIGMNAGISTLGFLLGNEQTIVVSTDLCEHPYTKEAAQWLEERYPDRIALHEGDSRKVLPELIRSKTQPFDLIFIDGGHQEEVVSIDLQNSLRLSHKRTLIVMDDLMPWVWYGEGPYRVWNRAVEAGQILQLGKIDTGEADPARRIWAWGLSKMK